MYNNYKYKQGEKMDKYIISIDGAFNVNCELFKDIEVKCNYLRVYIDKKEFVYENTKAVHNCYKATSILPRTTGVPLGDYLSFFNEYLDKGYRIFHFAMSKSVSSSLNSAIVAKNSLDSNNKIEIFETDSFSFGEGLYALNFINLLNKGYDINKIKEELSLIKNKIHTFIYIAHYEYFNNGGRAFLNSNYKYHLIHMDKEPVAKLNLYKEFNSSYLESIDIMLESFSAWKPNKDNVYIETLVLSDEMREELVKKLKDYGFKNVVVQEGLALCYAHIGHDAFMISYMGE